MMSAANGKRLLILIRCSPYGSSLARAALDVALAAAAFDQQPSLLFVGDGVLQLLRDQDSESLGVKNLGRVLSSLPLYDIDCIYVDTEAAQKYQLDLATAPLTAQGLDRHEMGEFIRAHDQLLAF